MKLPITLGALLCLFMPPWVNAATYYVDEHYGDNGNVPCRKSAPCRTLDFVIGMAGRNARIYVAPGSYYPASTLDINEDGIRIYALSGREVTTIQSSAATIFSVTGNKFILGAKDKGFTIRGTGNSGQSAIVISGTRPRIENNNITQNDSGMFPATEEAIRLNDGVGSATIRNNSISGWEYGILSTQSGTVTRHLITNNRVINIGDDCIDSSSGPGSADKIIDNVLGYCSFNGNSYSGILLNYATGRPSKPKVDGNAISSTDEAIAINGGSPTIRQNLVDFSGTGIQLEETDKAKIQDNFIWSGPSGSAGIHFSGSANTRATVTGNSTRFVDDALLIDNLTESPFQKISGNNFDGNGCPITLAGDDFTDRPIKMAKNHWGQYATVNQYPTLNAAGCTNTNAWVAEGNGTLQLAPQPLDMPNVIKFRGGPGS